MKILGAVVGAFALLFVGLALWAVGSYNGLVGRSENVNKAWAQVESQYQRRLDLVQQRQDVAGLVEDRHHDRELGNSAGIGGNIGLGQRKTPPLSRISAGSQARDV